MAVDGSLTWLLDEFDTMSVTRSNSLRQGSPPTHPRLDSSSSVGGRSGQENGDPHWRHPSNQDRHDRYYQASTTESAKILFFFFGLDCIKCLEFVAILGTIGTDRTSIAGPTPTTIDMPFALFSETKGSKVDPSSSLGAKSPAGPTGTGPGLALHRHLTETGSTGIESRYGQICPGSTSLFGLGLFVYICCQLLESSENKYSV